MTRQQKTPRQRAEEAVGVERRRVTKIGTKIAALKADLKTLEAEGETARKRLAYLEQNPDLAASPSTTSTHTPPSAP